MPSYAKSKDVSKQVTVKGEKLSALILSTMEKVSTIVGDTLGPGGRPVLIERQEHDLAPIATKDGVTVFRALGFQDATQQCIMESIRDASVRTANEAGDGTTTATILSYHITRSMVAYCAKHPDQSPQLVMRKIQTAMDTIVRPTIEALAHKADLTTDAGRDLLFDVARISANGDEALANAVLECYDTVGDQGHVTIVEGSGRSSYKVEKLDGYPIASGYEDSCAGFADAFINQQATRSTHMDGPVLFVLFDGRISNINSILPLLDQIGQRWAEGYETGEFLENGEPKKARGPRNVVVVAHGFSEQVLGSFAMMFAAPQSISVVPLITPHTNTVNGQSELLRDIQAVVGCSVIYNNIKEPLEEAKIDQLGPGVGGFEFGRFRSSILGAADDGGIGIGARAEALEAQMKNAISEFDKIVLQERIGKLTGGIAKLHVIGSSNAEIKEARDRAEDAICAVRGAIKSGVLPGGGWTLLKLIILLSAYKEPVFDEILLRAFEAPFERLLTNLGHNKAEIAKIRSQIDQAIIAEKDLVTFDAQNHAFVGAYDGGVLDSVPAVLQAVSNAISVAKMMGTLGGTVVFARDRAVELADAKSAREYLDNVAEGEAQELAETVSNNPANQRA